MKRRASLFINAEAGVNGDAYGNEESKDKNKDLNGFIVADNIEL